MVQLAQIDAYNPMIPELSLSEGKPACLIIYPMSTFDTPTESFVKELDRAFF